MGENSIARVPQVPSLIPLRRLGGDDRRETWLARDQACGDEVLMMVLRPTGDRAQLLQALARRRLLAAIHLMRIRDVLADVDEDAGAVVVVLDRPPGRSIAESVEESPHLPARRIAAIGSGILRGLVAMDSASIKTASISTADIHITPTGRALLTGIPASSGEALRPDRLRQVGQLLDDLHDGSDSALDDAISACSSETGADIAAVAARFAALERATIPSRPATDNSGSGQQGHPLAFLKGRRLASKKLALVLITCLIAIGGGLAWARSDRQEAGGLAAAASLRTGTGKAQPTPSDTASSLVSDDAARQLVTQLDAARTAAFSSADPTLLAGLYGPDSAAATADEAAVQALAAAGLHASGYDVAVRDARVQSRSSERLVVRVEDEQAAYDLVDSAGSVAAHRPARPAAVWLLEFTPDPSGSGQWLMSDVRPAEGT